ncbi:MAG: putative lipid II flippase FtsW [Acidimicrobiales bacterium]
MRDKTRNTAGGRLPAPTAYVLLLAMVGVLNLIGIVMVLSASSVIALRETGSSWFYFKRELAWVAVGSVAMVAAMRIDYHRWRRLSVPLLVGAIVLLLLVLVPSAGVTVNGSSRWLDLGALTVQPSEFAKLAVILFAADLLARRWKRRDDSRLTLRPVLIVFALVAALLLVQPNLGTTLVLALIVFGILFAAGVPTVPLSGYALAGAGAAVALALGEGYRRRRLLAFVDPWSDPLNTGYQTIQSQVSLASGGLVGVGLGASRAKWGFLPYAHTDFIYAIIGEELGLLGASLVVGLFLAIGYLGIRTALLAPDPFGRVLAAGITTWFCGQAFVNIGAVIGILPITGVPLPFVSFGGSSLVAAMAAAGVLLNIARHAK